MITFQQLIAACFHPIQAEQERADGEVFQGTEGSRVPGFESGTGVYLYRHDALSDDLDYHAEPLYMLYNPSRNECLLATTPIPYRDKHFLTEEAEAYTADEAFKLVAEFFKSGKKKVLPTKTR
jgi:hypothetical protein